MTSAGSGSMARDECPAAARSQIVTFLAITTALTAIGFVWMFRGAKHDLGAASLMMWVPGISAAVTAALTRAPIGGFGWRPGPARLLGLAFVLPAAVAVVSYGLAWVTGLAAITTDEVTHYRWARMLGLTLPVPSWVGVVSKASLGTLVAVVFALGEEIGWSGFLIPRLARLTSVSMTSLLAGGYWALWHYPAIIGGFYGPGTPLWVSLPGFTLALLGCTFMKTVLVLRSRSLWPGCLLHASHNTILMGIGFDMTVKRGHAAYFVSETGVLLGAVYLAAGIVFARSQRGALGVR